MAQVKEQNKTPEKELNKMEIANLSDVEFQTLVMRMFKETIGYYDNIKKTQAEMKAALSETKKNPQGTNSGRVEAENQINNLEHTEGKIIQKNKERLKNFWDI